MSELTFENLQDALKIHEINSILIPGAVFLYGFNLIYPQLGNFTSSNLSIGSIGVFVILSYGAGHLVQGFGNLIELYLITPIFGDLTKAKVTKMVDKDKVDIFKNCKKLCRGVASALLILLGFALINDLLTISDIYSVLLLISSIILFWYMRRFQKRELGI
jgi:hypothetical protein